MLNDSDQMSVVESRRLASVVKRLVEAHGGSIRVESKVGKESTFTVTIPMKSNLERIVIEERTEK